MAIDENKIKQITNRSEYFQDILDKIPSKITRWGNVAILLIFILISIGLKFIKYPDVVYSDAIITSENPPIDIYSRTSGRVTDILKKDQEVVKKGEWVIILNNGADYQDVKKIIELTKQINSTDFWESLNKIKINEQYLLGEIQNTFFQFSKSVEELNLFNELNSQNRQLNINFQRSDNLGSLKQKLENQLEILEKELSIAKLDFDRSSKLHSDGVVSKIETEQKEIAYLNIKDRLEGLKGNILNSQLQKDLLQKENTTLDVEKNDIYFKLRNNVLQHYNALQFELSEWQNKYVLSSPINGVINLYEIRNKDQYLSIDKKIFTVVPDLKQIYFALLKLPISNSGKVHKGQNCIIKLHNYSYTEYGMLRGIVYSISNTPKEGFYSVKLTLDSQLKTTTHKELDSKNELTGVAEIIIEDLTLFDRIFNLFTSENY